MGLSEHAPSRGSGWGDIGERGGDSGGMLQPCVSYTWWYLPQLVRVGDAGLWDQDAPLVSVPQSPSPLHSVPGAAPRKALVQGGSATSALLA